MICWKHSCRRFKPPFWANVEQSFKEKSSHKSSTDCLTKGQMVIICQPDYASVSKCVYVAKSQRALMWPETLPQWKATTWRAGWREEVLKPDRAGAFWAIKRHLAALFPSSCLWLSTCGYVFFSLSMFFYIFSPKAQSLRHLSLYKISWLSQFGQLLLSLLTADNWESFLNFEWRFTQIC